MSRAKKGLLERRDVRTAQALAEDVRYYGKWMRDEAFRRIGHLYPNATLTDGSKATIIAWLWARTIVCPNPVCAAALPLVSSYALSTKKGKAVWVEPAIDREVAPPRIRFTIKSGQGAPPEPTKQGQGRGVTFKCPCCGTLASGDHVKAEGKAGRMGAQLMTVVAEGARGRIYLPPSEAMEEAAREVDQEMVNEARVGFLSGSTPERLTGGTCFDYGLTSWGKLFTARQLVALTTFSDLVVEVRAKVLADAGRTSASEHGVMTEADYADAIALELAMVFCRHMQFGSTLSTWYTKDQAVKGLPQQALPMVWDYCEANPFGKSSANIVSCAGVVADCIAAAPVGIPCTIEQRPSQSHARDHRLHATVCTDPPYYDNVSYAGLSDFFYVWLRRSLKVGYGALLATIDTPKENELVAAAYRARSGVCSSHSWIEDMKKSLSSAYQEASSEPFCLYYAYKQRDLSKNMRRSASPGWETFLQAITELGFLIEGTWPLRTNNPNRKAAQGTSALASSIVLVCRKREATAPVTTRSAFLRALRAELPARLKLLQQGNIAPVDMAQASIGPGMSIFTRHARVLEADDTAMTVKTALQLINQALDEYLSEQEAEYDADTRFAITWFDSYGMEAGPAGQANVLANARNVSVAGVAASGILALKGDKVRLLARGELPEGWDPGKDPRLTVWECTQHLIRVLESGGETAAAFLLARLGARGDPARDLAYRLYGICERRKWAEEAVAYNGLVVVWPELARLSAQAPAAAASSEPGLLV